MTAVTHDPSVALVEISGLSKSFAAKGRLRARGETGTVAVDDVDLRIRRGETLGLVGESGCGKSTLADLLAGLTPRTAGQIVMSGSGAGHHGADIDDLRRNRKAFAERVQLISQDPYDSLNPRRSILECVAEPLIIQGGLTRQQVRDAVAEMLGRVGLTPAGDFMSRLPTELSGGQRQRVAIARALILRPDLVIADEPTSMLDVSIRVSIVQLIKELGREFGISFLFITHDLGVARYICDRIAVMYLGKIVEIAPTETLLAQPAHPYTRALLSAVPDLHSDGEIREVQIKGTIADRPSDAVTCRFRHRCILATETCTTKPHPPLAERAAEHDVACWMVD